MISSATISHFKSISEATLTFAPINTIVGLNGVGKSNIVDALYFVRDSFVEDLDTAITKRHGIESIRQWSKTRPYHLSIEIAVRTNTGFGRYKFTLASASGNYRIVEEGGEWWDYNPFKERADKDVQVKLASFRRSEAGEIKFETDVDQARRDIDQLKTRVNQYDLYATRASVGSFHLVTALLRPLFSEISDFVAYSIYPNTLRQPQVVSRRDELASDGSNLATILKHINNGNRAKKEAILQALSAILPQVTDFRVISAGGYYVPTIRVVEPSGEQHDFNMSQVSDGTLRMLGILAAFYQVSAPDVIALEEPEQMLHPGALPILVDAVKEYVDPSERSQRQVFLTTHSPQLLDLVPPESIIGASFEGGVTTYNNISPRHLSLIKDHLFTAGEILVAEGFQN